MEQAVSAWGQVDESAKACSLHYLALVCLPCLRDMRIGDLVNELARPFSGIPAFRSNIDRTVILNTDISAGLFLDLVDHLAFRPNHFADLIDRDSGSNNTRRIRAHLIYPVNAFINDFKDRHTGLKCLLQGGRKDIGRDTVKLGIKLQSSNELRCPGNLEVHIAEGILSTKDICKGLIHHLAVNITRNKPHSDTGNRSLQRHAGVKERHS